MNLHGLAGPAVSLVNPQITVSLRASTGSAVDGSGGRVPAYATPVSIPAQIQALTFRDLQQLEGLNLNGTRRAIYLYGRVDGIVRSLTKGGDLIDVATGVNAGTWLVAIVLEQFPDWVKAAITLQND